MIEISDLTVSFGGVRPLDGLDATLRAPIVGLIGPNGAGKTTLLNVLSGFVRPGRGTIMMDGVNLLPLRPAARVRHGLRRTFQQQLVADDLTVWQNVQAIADHVGGSGAKAQDEIARALDFVGLRERRDVAGRALNPFERRLTEIAKTLIGRPCVILMDEPGAGLNERETARLREVIMGIPPALNAQVILIDHDTNLIATTCSETLVLDFGKRLALGPTRAALDDPAVRKAYLGNAQLSPA
jgi:branched-chain amino acid transport system ATP-binding protein